MDRNTIVQVLQILIQFIIAPFLVWALIHAKDYLIAHVGQTNYTKYAAVVKDIVYAIEQQYPDMVGSEKYKSAMYAINEKLGNILTDKEINTLIESTVASINLVTKGAIKKASDPIETKTEQPTT